MVVIQNNWFPFGNYKAINILGILFTKESLTVVDINHERIHTEQGIELLWVGFYIIYILEWILNLCKYRNLHTAYRNISFEREAYENQYNLDYIKTRNPYSQWNI